MTVKNLNSIMFEEEKGDTPMALLRGIKFGTESYHVLFKRLCRCVDPLIIIVEDNYQDNYNLLRCWNL